MRRLYSTFADSWPGVGLLLMRLVGGAALVVRAHSTLGGSPWITETLASACLASSGILLIPGLWTPIAGTVAAFIVLGQMLTGAGDRSAPLLLGSIALTLAMLGPGVWSVDARLFGWKRVEAPHRRTGSKVS